MIFNLVLIMVIDIKIISECNDDGILKLSGFESYLGMALHIIKLFLLFNLQPVRYILLLSLETITKAD